MATAKWAEGLQSRGAVLGAELNALASGAYSVLGTEFDNTVGLHQWFWFELVGGGAINPTTGANIEIYAVASLDGSTYPSAPSSTNPGWQHLADTVSVPTGSHTIRVGTLIGVKLPPAKLKFCLRNNTNVTLAATGNVLNLYSSNDAATG